MYWWFFTLCLFMVVTRTLEMWGVVSSLSLQCFLLQTDNNSVELCASKSADYMTPS